MKCETFLYLYLKQKTVPIVSYYETLNLPQCVTCPVSMLQQWLCLTVPTRDLWAGFPQDYVGMLHQWYCSLGQCCESGDCRITNNITGLVSAFRPAVCVCTKI